MAKRDWINPPSNPIQTLHLDSTHMEMPTEPERLKECLLSLADLAHSLKPGQFMVIQRHTGTEHPDHRLFTARVYATVEDKL